MTTTTPQAPPASPAHLLRTLRHFAEDPSLLRRADLEGSERTWEQVARTPHLQVWVIGWPPGTSTGWHDHGGAVGAFRVVRGALTEHTWSDGEQVRTLGRGDLRLFPGAHVHDVRNTGSTHALSVHVYSPHLEQMTRYQVSDGRLTVAEVDTGESW